MHAMALGYLVAGAVFLGQADEQLFVAKPLTKSDEFTAGIKGPACDTAGNIYAVNFAKEGTIGRVTPQGKGEIFVTLPTGNTGNGIRFDKAGTMFVADYSGHNILSINMKTRGVKVLAHEGGMSQPNDLAIAPNGTLYASDPNWDKSTGQIWRIRTDGSITRVAKEMGTANGIDVSPDGNTLYVNESDQRKIWSFAITKSGDLSDKRLLATVPDFGFDGMRCDVDGNLYVARYGKGVVAKFSPKGEVLHEIDVLGKQPSNVCFGGPDGRTVYVTEVEHTRLVEFRVDRPGQSWKVAHTKK